VSTKVNHIMQACQLGLGRRWNILLTGATVVLSPYYSHSQSWNLGVVCGISGKTMSSSPHVRRFLARSAQSYLRDHFFAVDKDGGFKELRAT